MGVAGDRRAALHADLLKRHPRQISGNQKDAVIEARVRVSEAQAEDEREDANEQSHQEERMRQRPDGAKRGAGKAVGDFASGKNHEQAQVPAYEVEKIASQGERGPHDERLLRERAAPLREARRAWIVAARRGFATPLSDQPTPALWENRVG